MHVASVLQSYPTLLAGPNNPKQPLRRYPRDKGFVAEPMPDDARMYYVEDVELREVRG